MTDSDESRGTEDSSRLEDPLSATDLDFFVQNGFVLLKKAFDPDVAAACRSEIWRVIEGESRAAREEGSNQGITRSDPSTWPLKFPLARIYGAEEGPPWRQVFTPRLVQALDQLCGGREQWRPFGCGWWMVTFPGQGRQARPRSPPLSPSSSCSLRSPHEHPSPTPSPSSPPPPRFPPPPWRLEGHWHIDGRRRRRCLHPLEVGLVPIFLFSDVREGGGGTALCQGSHKWVARLLREAGPAGMDAAELIRRGQAWVEGEEGGCRVVETVGEAGDVMFTHPFLLHGRSRNNAAVPVGGGEEGVRFMCHPGVALREAARVDPTEGGRSVVERAIMAAWEGGESGGKRVFSHAQCCTLEAGREREKRRRKRKGEMYGQGVEEGEEGEGREVPEGVDGEVAEVMGMVGFGAGARKGVRRKR